MDPKRRHRVEARRRLNEKLPPKPELTFWGVITLSYFYDRSRYKAAKKHNGYLVESEAWRVRNQELDAARRGCLFALIPGLSQLLGRWLGAPDAPPPPRPPIIEVQSPADVAAGLGRPVVIEGVVPPPAEHTEAPPLGDGGSQPHSASPLAP